MGWGGPSEARFPEEYDDTWVVAVFYMNELLAGHVTDGEWEPRADYRSRVDSNSPFRVVRYSISGR